MNHERDFAEIIQEIEALRDSDRTDVKADLRLERALRAMRRAERAYRNQLRRDPESPDQPDDGPADPQHKPAPPKTKEGDYVPPAEPVFARPKVDFRFHGDTGACEPVSDLARSALVNPGQIPGPYSIATAFRKFHEEHATKELVCGVEVMGRVSDPNPIALGGGWSKSDPRGVGGDHLRVAFVGGTPDAEVSVNLGGKYGSVEECYFFDVHLRGPKDSFILRQGARVGTLVIDGGGFVKCPDFGPDQTHTSGVHLGHGWDMLYIARVPLSPDCPFREHRWYRHGGGETWIVDNELVGGNRTATQDRPSPVIGDERPHGTVVYARNRGDGSEWPHQYLDGGSCLSQWGNPDHDTWWIENKITNWPLGCVLVGWQPPSAGNFLNERGFAHGRHLFLGNTFTNPKGDRSCVNINAAEEVHFLGGNEIDAGGVRWDITLGSEWASRYDPPPIGQVFVHDDDTLTRFESLNVGAYVPSVGAVVPMSVEQLRAMRYYGP